MNQEIFQPGLEIPALEGLGDTIASETAAESVDEKAISIVSQVIRGTYTYLHQTYLAASENPDLRGKGFAMYEGDKQGVSELDTEQASKVSEFLCTTSGNMTGQDVYRRFNWIKANRELSEQRVAMQLSAAASDWSVINAAFPNSSELDEVDK